MTSQQIQTLLAPPNTEESYLQTQLLLNSRFKSLDDLDELDTSVEDSLGHRDYLGSQLSICQSNVTRLISETHSSAKSHLHSAQELSLVRHSLADELSYLSRELVSSMSDGDSRPTLLEDIETLHRSLRELESVKSYVHVIEHALKLSESAVQQIRNSLPVITESSITEYQALQDFLSNVSKGCSQVEDGAGPQALQLLSFLDKVRDKTWTDMKGVLSVSLLAASEKLKWPMPVEYASASLDDRKAFEAAFLNLLQLQQIGEKLWPLSGPYERSEKDGLYPIQALVQPVSLRFKYHFEGTRQTNRADKPEWYFTHVLNVVHEHRPFMESVIQRILSLTKYRNVNAWLEFTLLILPLLSRKLNRTVPFLLTRPSLLAHTIYQALAFDAALVEGGFSLSGTSAGKPTGDGANGRKDKWDGISEVILGKKEWFDTWMEGEKKFAEDQYHEIISAPDAWLVDDEEIEEVSFERELRSTNSARRIKSLVEQVTDRYSPLPQFTQRTRFLISVQLPLLEYYHARIFSSLDAFETLSSAFVRAVPGGLGVSMSGGGAEGSVKVDTGRLTSGVDGIQRLCKALVSARFIEEAMEGWGEELFFLELWAEINQRAYLRARAEAHASLPDPKVAEEGTPDDTIFEELVRQYAKLSIRAEDMIVQQICGEIEGGLRTHFSSPKSEGEQTDGIALSATLLMPIALLSSHLTFLRTALPQITVINIYRRIASRLSEHIFNRQILYRGRQRLTVPRGKAIWAECELWVETCQAALSGSCSRARVETPWLRLLEGGRLIAAEGLTWQKLVDVTFGVGDDVEWEEVVEGTVGVCEMKREEVGQVLRTREDCVR